MRGRDEKRAQIFSRKLLKRKDQLRDLEKKEDNIKMDLSKQNMTMWTGFFRLRRGSSGVSLWTE
jgi:hypothetical protein